MSTTQNPKSPEAVAERHIEWTFGWEQEPDSPEFDFATRFEHLYDFSGDSTIYYDDFDAEHRAFRSATVYGEAWQSAFRKLRSARHGIVTEPSVIIEGDLAVSYGVFVARIEPRDRDIVYIRTTSSLIWRFIDGAWRIARDHTSSQILDSDEFERLWATASRVRTSDLEA